jgi:hypothetical protein
MGVDGAAAARRPMSLGDASAERRNDDLDGERRQQVKPARFFREN